MVLQSLTMVPEFGRMFTFLLLAFKIRLDQLNELRDLFFSNTSHKEGKNMNCVQRLLLPL